MHEPKTLKLPLIKPSGRIARHAIVQHVSEIPTVGRSTRTFKHLRVEES